MINKSTRDDIAQRSDAGQHPEEIAAALKISAGRVYTVLREIRPDRKRKPRIRTSDMHVKVRYLAGAPLYAKPARIAELLDCSRAYVYRILSETA